MQFPINAPGFYRIMIGHIEVICIDDGTLETDIQAVVGIPVEQARALFDASFFPLTLSNSSNTYIIRSQGRTALVDTGAGPFLYKTSGRTLANAAAAGIVPADIDTILFTHIHPDHCSGLMNIEWEKVFPQALLKMHVAEFAFWLSEDPPSRKLAHVKNDADHVSRFMTPYQDQIRVFEDGEVFPGVYTVALPGHTPGHTGYMIRSQGKQMLIWGDVIHWPAVQFAMPNAAMIYDVDPVQAVATRWNMLNEAASAELLVAGMHHWFPGITRVRREGGGFTMAPLPWGHDPFAK